LLVFIVCLVNVFSALLVTHALTAEKVKGKGKDVDLYSVFHAPRTANVHVTETGPSDRYLGHRQACEHSPGSDLITGTGSASQLVLGLHLHNPSLMDYYLFNRPRRDGWLSWPCWLTDSGRFTHKVVTRPAVSLAQERRIGKVRRPGPAFSPLCYATNQNSLPC